MKESIKIGLTDYFDPSITKSIDITDDTFGSTLWNSLLSFYQSVDNLGSSFPKEHLYTLKQVLCDLWHVFRTDIEDFEWENDVVPLLRKKIEKENQRNFDCLCKKKIGILEFLSEDLIKQNSIFSCDGWLGFCREIKRNNRFHCESLNDELLTQFLSKLIITVKKERIIYRARVMKEKMSEPYKIENMGMPPYEKACSGRMNPDGIPYLYASDDEDTAIHEVRSALHDYVTVAKFMVKSDLTLINLKGLTEITPFSDIDFFTLAVNRKPLSDMYQAIIKPMRKFDTDIESLPTQYIAELIKNMNHKVDGIEYPSVMNSKGLNYLLFSQEKIDGVETRIREIRSIDYKYQ